jgi:acetyl esterase/lipase
MPEPRTDVGEPQRETLVQIDQVYLQRDRPLHWDVYRPASAGKAARPAVLVLHGGGWRMGDRGMVAPAATVLAQLGFVALAVEYRLLGEAPWPAPLDDVTAALRSAVDQADSLGIDSSQLFVMGYSAGGHLALLAASQHGAPAVAGVAAFFAPIRLGPQDAGMLDVALSAIAAASPMTFADRMPPTILFAGDGDRMVPASHAIDLHSAMRAAGRVADLRLYSDLIHEFVRLPGMMRITLEDAVAFFRRTSLDRDDFSLASAQLAAWWEQMLPKRPES